MILPDAGAVLSKIVSSAVSTDKCKPMFRPETKMRRGIRYLHVFFILTCVIIFAFWMDGWLRGEMGIAKRVAEYVGNQWSTHFLIGVGILYVLLLSLPFVPGVELGVLLMCVFGKEGIALVYFATVAGLNLAFLIGRSLPQKWVYTRLGKVGFLDDTECRFDNIDSAIRINSLSQRFFPRRFISFLAKYPYPAIGILFNLPGNYLIGGGGGISLVCGISRNVSWKWFLLTVIVAVSPVPLLAWFGVIQLEIFLGIM